MRSTMQEAPLSIATLVRYGTTVHGTSEVLTWTGDGVRSATYAEVGRRCRPARPRAARPRRDRRRAGRAPSCGTTRSTWRPTSPSRPWAPCCTRSTSGSSRSSSSTSPTTPRTRSSSSTARCCRVLAKVLPQLTTVEHVVVNGPADLSALDGAHATVHAYAELLAGQPEEFDWPELDERRRRRHVLHRPAPPATRRASSTATARSTCTRCRSACPTRSGLSAGGPGAADRAAVPRATPGALPYAAFMTGASLRHAGPVPAAGAAGRR